MIPILIFCALLAASAAAGLSVLPALIAGLAVFLIDGRRRGHSWNALLRACLEGVRTVHGILIAFLLIGMLTAVWRLSGCIPSIVCYAAALMRPGVFLLLTFLLCCGMSLLTGTSFGTAATVGVICMTIGRAMGLSPVWMGGAIVGGAFFGDRASPVSTSALLVSTLTETELYDNVRRMLRGAVVPLLLSCAVYLIAGFLVPAAGEMPDVSAMFRAGFTVHPLCAVPAVCVLVPACLRVNVRRTLLCGIISALFVAAFIQHASPADILTALVLGYRSPVAELAPIVNGGGIVSMLRAAATVCIASCFSGIFRLTGLLLFLQEKIEKPGGFFSALLAAIPSCAVACNQTLGIMLTHQLCAGLPEKKERLALDLADTAVVIAPLFPWSIAGGVPLASVGAPTLSLVAAVFLWLVPLWRCVTETRGRRRAAR